MKRKKLKLSMLAIVVFSLFFSASAVNAAVVGVKISPMKIEDLVNPGQILNRSIKVTNSSDSEKTFYLFTNDFIADGETGQPKLVDAGSEATGLAEWINISTEGIKFSPNEEKQIDFTISVPENAGPGGYYGAVLVGTEPQDVKLNSEDKGAAMATSQKTAALVLLQVAGSVNESARIRDFITEKSVYGTPYDVDFVTRIENMGNSIIKPKGAITIYNFFGKEVATIHVNEGGSNILRSSLRKFDERWTGGMGFGKYKASIGLNFGTPTTSGGQGVQSMYSEAYFWIFPWKLMAYTALILFIIIGIVALSLKTYKDRAVRRAMEQIGARQRRPVNTIKSSENFGLRAAIISIVVLIAILVAYFIFFA